MKDDIMKRRGTTKIPSFDIFSTDRKISYDI